MTLFIQTFHGALGNGHFETDKFKVHPILLSFVPVESVFQNVTRLLW